MIEAPSISPLLFLFAVLLCQTPFVSAAEKNDGVAPPAIKVEVTGSGRPMILIPGLGCGGNVWDGTVAHFKDRYQCHVVTLAGFAGQPAIGEPFLQQVHDALAAYIRDQKLERPVIVGHSLGGYMAFWLGADLPGKVGPIIALDGVPYFPALMDPKATPQLQQPVAAMFRGVLSGQSPAQFAMGNQMILATMITDPKDMETVAALSNKSDPKAVGQAFYEMVTTDLRDKMKAIQSPVLLLGPSDPAETPDDKERKEASYRAQVAAIARHQVAFAPKARHFIQLDAPDFFFQEADAFLQKASIGNP